MGAPGQARLDSAFPETVSGGEPFSGLLGCGETQGHLAAMFSAAEHCGENERRVPEAAHRLESS
jgi:hypothetical protein